MSFKKWLYKYKYLQFELQEVESKLQNYMTQFNDYFDLPKKDPSPPQTDPPPPQPESEELEKKPELVKTMSVSPPKNSGDIRLICIKSKKDQVDLQPCGGTHIKNTSEIGRIVIGKIEKKTRLLISSLIQVL